MSYHSKEQAEIKPDLIWWYFYTFTPLSGGDTMKSWNDRDSFWGSDWRRTPVNPRKDLLHMYRHKTCNKAVINKRQFTHPLSSYSLHVWHSLYTVLFLSLFFPIRVVIIKSYFNFVPLFAPRQISHLCKKLGNELKNSTTLSSRSEHNVSLLAKLFIMCPCASWKHERIQTSDSYIKIYIYI